MNHVNHCPLNCLNHSRCGHSVTVEARNLPGGETLFRLPRDWWALVIDVESTVYLCPECGDTMPHVPNPGEAS